MQDALFLIFEHLRIPDIFKKCVLINKEIYFFSMNNKFLKCLYTKTLRDIGFACFATAVEEHTINYSLYQKIRHVYLIIKLHLLLKLNSPLSSSTYKYYLYKKEFQ